MFERGDDLVIALADGAGGTGNVTNAAQAIIDAVGAAGSGVEWSELLADLEPPGLVLGLAFEASNEPSGIRLGPRIQIRRLRAHRGVAEVLLGRGAGLKQRVTKRAKMRKSLRRIEDGASLDNETVRSRMPMVDEGGPLLAAGDNVMKDASHSVDIGRGCRVPDPLRHLVSRKRRSANG